MSINSIEKKYEFPKIVHVETTNICNLKCIHCPHSNLESIPNYKPENMNMNIFTNIAKEVGENKGILRLTPDGEPLLHPDWHKQVEVALNSGIDIFCFNTNGLLMSEKNSESLFLETNTKIVVEFSIDSLYKNSYSKIRGGDYILLLSNIFTFLKEIKKRNKTNIKVMVSCVVQPELEDDEYANFVKFWTPIVDKVITRNYVDTKGLTPYKPEVQILPEVRWACPVPYTRLVIGIDGLIRFCPDDWLKSTVVDNLTNKTIKEVWSSEFMNNLRKSHSNGTFDHATCKHCKDWSVIKWDYDYVSALNDLF